eukprot:Sspe_Gene.13686::Locus_4696_Transcript_1_1_Confidence_1.000_Length_2844::g.13686::m.13686
MEASEHVQTTDEVHAATHDYFMLSIPRYTTLPPHCCFSSLHAKSVVRPRQPLVVRGQLAGRRTLFHSSALQLVETNESRPPAPDRRVPVRGEILVVLQVGHDLGVRGAPAHRRAVDIVVQHQTLVVHKVMGVVARLLTGAPVSARPLPRLEGPRVDAVLPIIVVHKVQVVVVLRVVPTVVLLQPLTVDDVVVDIVPARPVVVVETLRPPVVGNDDVFRDVGEGGVPPWLLRTIADVGPEELPIPRVDGSMVAALAALVEDHVLRHRVPSPEPIVEVDPRPGAVEEEVVGDVGLRRLGLEPARRLQLEDAKFVADVVGDGGVPRLLAVRPVMLVGVPPRGHRRVPNPLELVPLHRGVAVVPAQNQRIPVHTAERAPAYGREVGSLKEDSPSTVQRPVATRRWCPRFHVSDHSVPQPKPLHHNLLHRLLLRPLHLDEPLQTRRHELQV